MKFCPLVFELHLAQNFCHRHIDIHLPEIVKSFSGHSKTFKSIKNWKSKIFTKLILSSIYIEESKMFVKIIKKKSKCENVFIILFSMYNRKENAVLNSRFFFLISDFQSYHNLHHYYKIFLFM